MEQQLTIDGIGTRLRHSIDASRLLTRELPPEAPAPAGAHGLAAMAEQTISELLRLLDEHLSIRAAFVARQTTHDGGALAATGHEATAGSGIGVPIRLADGYVYGMLCFFRTCDDGPLDDRDVRRLQMSARVAARMIDGAYAHGIAA